MNVTHDIYDPDLYVDGPIHEIFAELGQRHSQVWYFAAPPLLHPLEALADAAPWQNITVHPYPPRPGDLFA